MIFQDHSPGWQERMYYLSGPRIVKHVFELLKEKCCTYPILQYPDPNKSYVLFTDASKYGWAGVLRQPYEEINELDQLTTEYTFIKMEDSLSPCIIHQLTI